MQHFDADYLIRDLSTYGRLSNKNASCSDLDIFQVDHLRVPPSTCISRILLPLLTDEPPSAEASQCYQDPPHLLLVSE